MRCDAEAAAHRGSEAADAALRCDMDQMDRRPRHHGATDATDHILRDEPISAATVVAPESSEEFGMLQSCLRPGAAPPPLHHSIVCGLIYLNMYMSMYMDMDMDMYVLTICLTRYSSYSHSN